MSARTVTRDGTTVEARHPACSQTYVEWFGFITIPLLALVAFSIIVALLVAAHRKRP